MRDQMSIDAQFDDLRRPVTPTDVRRIADLLADTDDELDTAFIAVMGRSSRVDEEVHVEGAILADPGLFRCKVCDLWLSTTRIDPDKEEWCYGCAQEWKEARDASA